MSAPTPAEFQPRISVWGHLWRTLLMLLISGGVWATVADRQTGSDFLLELAAGIPAIGLVFFRRRWPLFIAVLLAGLGTVSALAAGPATLAAVSLATRRRWWQILVVAVINVATAYGFTLVQPVAEEPGWVTILSNLAAVSAMMAWGMYIGSRRELLWTLRNRAERAEAEQELRASRARSNERERIAREMHDVLAHRISQISMHAGGLAFRQDLSADEMRTSAGIIQQKAHEALQDLRGVLGVLRDASTGALVEAPQPTWSDLPRLIQESRDAGMKVDFENLVLIEETPLPDPLGRALYRITQEGLTNARKHAPEALVSVRVGGSLEQGLDILVTNPIGFGASLMPGAGLGLVGLSERAELVGGRLEHGRDGSTFVLRGWLPWAP